MSGVNRATILGNIGQDPDIRYTPSGACVANFSIATSEKWKDKNTGQVQEETTWHNITAFGKLAEIISQYVKKGSKVYIEGKLKTESWEQDGQKKYKTVIVARELQMLDSRQGTEQSDNNAQQRPQQSQAQQPVQQWGNQPPQRPQPQQQGAYNANQHGGLPHQNPNNVPMNQAQGQQGMPQQQQPQNFDDFDDDIPF